LSFVFFFKPNSSQTRQCGTPHHICCLSPPLPSIPEGEWFCPGCTAKPGAPIGDVPNVASTKTKGKGTKKDGIGAKKEAAAAPKRPAAPKKEVIYKDDDEDDEEDDGDDYEEPRGKKRKAGGGKKRGGGELLIMHGAYAGANVGFFLASKKR
jgi:hypothetical protein